MLLLLYGYIAFVTGVVMISFNNNNNNSNNNNNKLSPIYPDPQERKYIKKWKNELRSLGKKILNLISKTS